MADDKKLDYITDKLDFVADKIYEIDTNLQVHIARFESVAQDSAEDRRNIKRNTEVLQENTVSLQDHMKRTDILEAYVKGVESRFTPVEMDAMRRKAVNEWAKSRVFFLAKLGGAITGLGAAAGLVKFLIGYFA